MRSTRLLCPANKLFHQEEQQAGYQRFVIVELEVYKKRLVINRLFNALDGEGEAGDHVGTSFRSLPQGL